jgi:hypothetical protein
MLPLVTRLLNNPQEDAAFVICALICNANKDEIGHDASAAACRTYPTQMTPQVPIGLFKTGTICGSILSFFQYFGRVFKETVLWYTFPIKSEDGVRNVKIRLLYGTDRIRRARF